MRKDYIDYNTRVDEHARVDAEIEKILKEGYTPGSDSVAQFSRYLYTEVAYGFLCDRTEAILAKQKKEK